MVRGGSVQNKFGEFMFDELIGHPYGHKFFSSKGLTGFVYPMRATPELLTAGGLTHRTQLVHSSDVSYVTSALRLRAGHTVVEAGTGSGSLTNALARLTGDSGHVFSFEFHAERAQQARETFALIGNEKRITVTHRDVCEAGFLVAERLGEGEADAVFLDLPCPWTALPHALKVLKSGGGVCCYSPCLEQVMQTCATLRSLRFEDVRTVEVRQHPYDSDLVNRQGYEFDGTPEQAHLRGPKKKERAKLEDPDTMLLLRPRSGETAGHTAFLTFASKLISIE